MLYFLSIVTVVSSYTIIHKDVCYRYYPMCEFVVNRKEQINNPTTVCPLSTHIGHINNNKECIWNNSLHYLQHEVIKNHTGLVLIKFDYPLGSCNYTKFCTVELYVEDGTNEGQLHSSVYSINFENDKITAVFNYVFSGTYFVKINDMRSTKTYINTQYELMELDNKSFEFIDNSEHANKNIKFTLKFKLPYFIDDEPKVLVRIIKCINMFETVSSNTTCNPLCVSESTSFRCHYDNIEPRIYKLEFIVLDDVRCNTHSIFCKNKHENCCKFYTKFEIHNITSNRTLEDNNSNSVLTQIVIILIIAVIMITIVTIFIFYKNYFKYQTPLRTPTYTQLQNQNFNQNFEILLLYARDAEVFMKMITAFKNLIETDNAIIISDIYEFDGKNVDPMRWLEEKLINNKTKVILFLNECASLVYEHDTNIYKEPHCFDHLFKQSIVFLTNNKYKQSYEKIFVAKLSCVSGDNCFNFLNPLVRYLMPQHINELLNNVWSTQESNIDNLLLNEFKKKCKDCFKFYEKNYNYIYELLNIEKG